MEDKIDAFHRSINDAQLFDGLGERTLEELVIEFDNDFLLAIGAFYTLGAEFYALIELFKAALVHIVGGAFHGVDNALQGPRNGVVLREIVVLK